MKPDSRIDGRKKKNVICIACSWFCATVENVSPSVRLAAMNSSTARIEQRRGCPCIGTREDEPREQRASASPGSGRSRRRGRSCRSSPRAPSPASASRFSIVPRSRSRVIASPVISTIVIVRIDAHQPRDDVVLRDRLGVVARVRDELERAGLRRERRAAGRSGRATSADCASWAERRQRVAGRRRVGRVGLDQQRRPLAADQRAREVRPESSRRTAPRRSPASARRRLRPRPRRRMRSSRCCAAPATMLRENSLLVGDRAAPSAGAWDRS